MKERRVVLVDPGPDLDYRVRRAREAMDFHNGETTFLVEVVGPSELAERVRKGDVNSVAFLSGEAKMCEAAHRIRIENPGVRVLVLSKEMPAGEVAFLEERTCTREGFVAFLDA